eukprot:TRINITY_DN58940_c0_g1_i1.p1 TRINITY_DN58940_c0_g1~~TRINITY_DN58940_c0_g1_i1.p1  ORF type:complete len:684 (+),score=150.80 TRINITY_DN58940_c0_g1_i1:153-2204(+)
MSGSIYPKPAPGLGASLSSGYDSIEIPEKPAKAVQPPPAAPREVVSALPVKHTANGAGADPLPDRRSVACAPCRPLTYTVAVYLLLLEPIFTFVFTFLVLFFFAWSIPLLVLCGAGLPVLWGTLWLSRVSTKFAAWCYGGLGAQTPRIPTLPAHRGGFFGIFRCAQSWRSLAFTALVRPIVAAVIITLLIVVLVVGIAAAIGPIVAIVTAARGVTPGWTIAVAAVAFPFGLAVLYGSVCCFPAAAGLFAWVLSVTVGHPPRSGAAMALTGVVDHPAYATNLDGDRASPIQYHPHTALAALYSPDAADHAAFAPALRVRRRRGCCHVCGVLVGCVLFALVLTVLTALAAASVLATLARVNCHQAEDVYDQAVAYTAPAMPSVLNVSLDAIADVRYTNDTRWLGNTTAGSAPAAGVRLVVRSYGSASTFEKYFTPNVDAPAAGTASSYLEASLTATGRTIHRLDHLIDRWLSCTTARVVVAVSDAIADGPPEGALVVDAHAGLFSTSPHADWLGGNAAAHAPRTTIRGFQHVNISVKHGAVDVLLDLPVNGTADLSVNSGESRVRQLRLADSANATVHVKHGEAAVDAVEFPPPTGERAALDVSAKYGEATVRATDGAGGTAFAGTAKATVRHGDARVRYGNRGQDARVIVWTDNEKEVELSVGGLAPHALSTATKHGEASVSSL